MVAKQYEIYLTDLNPTKGAEMQKVRPCVIISPDEMNKHLRTVQIAPLTSTGKSYPWRVDVSLNKKSGKIALDHIRSIDKSRLIKKSGELTQPEIKTLKATIKTMLVD